MRLVRPGGRTNASLFQWLPIDFVIGTNDSELTSFALYVFNIFSLLQASSLEKGDTSICILLQPSWEHYLHYCVSQRSQAGLGTIVLSAVYTHCKTIPVPDSLQFN